MPRQPFPIPTADGKQAAATIESSLRELRGMLQDPFYMDGTPLEVQAVMKKAEAQLEEVLGALSRSSANKIGSSPGFAGEAVGV